MYGGGNSVEQLFLLVPVQEKEKGNTKELDEDMIGRGLSLHDSLDRERWKEALCTRHGKPGAPFQGPGANK